MKHLFVPYELALKLKEKKFNEPCISFYSKDEKLGFDGKYHSIKDGYKNSTVNDIWIKKYKEDYQCVTSPLYQQVVDWFREKHKIHIAVSSFPIYNNKYGYQYNRGGITSSGWTPYFEGETYYDTFNKVIEEALNLIK